MNTGIASILVAVISAGALIAFIVAMRRRTARTVSWTSGGYFLLILAWVGSLGYAIGAVTGQRRAIGYVIGQNTRYFGVAQIVVAATGVLTLAFCLLALRLWVRRGNNIGFAGLVAVALGCFGIYVNLFNQVESSGNRYIELTATMAALVAATVIRPGKEAVLGPAVYGISLGMMSAIVAVVNPSGAFQSCRADKCGPIGLLFAGALGNENALGLALALSFPFVLLAFRGPAQWILGFYMFVMVYLTGSRTALIAASVALCVALICNPRIRGETVRGRLGLVAVLTGITAVLLGLILPFATTDQAAFSYRGLAWETAKRHIADAPVFGSGADAWQALSVTGEVRAATAYSAHNLWIDVLFTGGVVGLLVASVLLVALLSTSPPWLMALPLVTVLAAGIFERPWTLTATNWLVWVLPSLLLLRRERILDEAAAGYNAQPSAETSYRGALRTS